MDGESRGRSGEHRRDRGTEATEQTGKRDRGTTTQSGTNKFLPSFHGVTSDSPAHGDWLFSGGLSTVYQAPCLSPLAEANSEQRNTVCMRYRCTYIYTTSTTGSASGLPSLESASTCRKTTWYLVFLFNRKRNARSMWRCQSVNDSIAPWQ